LKEKNNLYQNRTPKVNDEIQKVPLGVRWLSEDNVKSAAIDLTKLEQH